MRMILPMDAVRKPARNKGKQKTANAVRRPAAQKLKRRPDKREVPVLSPEMMEERRREEDEYLRRRIEHDLKKAEELKQILKQAQEEKKQAVARLQGRGFVFNPSDEVLVDLYLKEKNSGRYIDLCPFEEVDVYGTHPQTLTEKYNSNGGVWHFFTQSRPHENSGQWEFGEKNDVFCNGVKVGARQELEYSSSNGGGKYKILEYQLEPATESNSEAAPWFICELLPVG